MVEWWNPGMGIGEIDPTCFKQPPIPLRRGEQLVFHSPDLRGFDPHRLNKTDVVEFSLEQTKDGLRAANLEVSVSVAENCEGGDTKPRTFAVKLEGGAAISGFTMAYADWQRLRRAAVAWSDATNDRRPYLAGFIEEALKEKVAACEAAAGQLAVAVPMAEPAPASGADAGIISPSITAIRLLDAIGQFRNKVNEAGALALLNADSMTRGIENLAGWEHFELVGVSDGLHGLAHAALNRLQNGLGAFERMYQPSIERLRTMTAPVTAVSVSEAVESAILTVCRINEGAIVSAMECDIDAMRGLLNGQSDTLCERHHEYVFALVEVAEAELAEAYKNFWAAKCGFNNALASVEMAQRVAAERRAA